ncbi:MAG: hypothetical protein QOI01_1731 [Mycobacterium sp.]|jgi:hypothetical protein|nr:hypothetical protein [Mycobacterium sp.]MDT7756477.1 hypothetical protein [Mycobacterium sp.]
MNERHVLADIELLHEVGALEEQADVAAPDAGTLPLGAVADPLAGDAHGAAIGVVHACQA